MYLIQELEAAQQAAPDCSNFVGDYSVSADYSSAQSSANYSSADRAFIHHSLAQPLPVTSRRITLVGGRGAMGRFFARQFSAAGHQVNILEQENWDHAQEILEGADLVLMCVPIECTLTVIQTIAPYLAPTTALADITSIKAPIVQSMLAHHSGPVLGLHPMFGPQVSSFHAQNIVVCPGRDHAAFQWLLALMEQDGAKLTVCTAEEHDQMMVNVQSVRHCLTLGLGLFLNEQGADVEQSLAFSSPSYRELIEMTDRLFAQAPELVADIILFTEERREAIVQLADVYHRLAQIARHNDREALILELQSAQQIWNQARSQKQQPTQHEQPSCQAASKMKTHDLHVVETRPLISPAALHEELPITDTAVSIVSQTRDGIRNILQNEDQRLLVIVGPCSIHDVEAAHEYGEKLAVLRRELQDDLEIVMRVYFEKPRTTIGWKGLINDPHLDGSYDINTGLRVARKLLLDLANMGLPAATELLDPVIPQYIADVISWTAIGARTTESQTHREMASGLSMPVGFKNNTDGSLSAAANAILAASQPHHFLGVDRDGAASIISTTGNPDGHLVLRGGKDGPNYQARFVQQASQELSCLGLTPRVMIDCSHGNANKDYAQQPVVLQNVREQVEAGSRHIMGVMIESHLIAGRQEIGQDRKQLVYGQSITDACVDFSTTAHMLRTLARSVKSAGGSALAAAHCG